MFPEWGRFLTPDSFEYLDPSSINGVNLYAYCYNDPINKYDPSGHAPWWSWLISGLQVLGGIALMLVGGATMAFGANEVIAATSGTNYIQQWTGMSDVAYGWTYFGLNLASFVGQIVGTRYRQIKTRTAIYNPDGSVKQYRYYRSNGNKLYDEDFNHSAFGNPNIKFPHYHGWTSAGIRATDHQSYIKLIIWLLLGGR